MITIGVITGSSVKPNKDGVNPTRLLQVVVSDPMDVQTVELITQAGEDNNPPIGSKVVMIDLGPAWQVGIAVDDNIAPEVQPGEKEYYSSVGGVKKAKLKLNLLGECILNDGVDFGVAFNQLKAAFDDLQTQWNIFADAYVPGGPLAVGTPPKAFPATVSIDGAKVTKVRL